MKNINKQSGNFHIAVIIIFYMAGCIAGCGGKRSDSAAIPAGPSETVAVMDNSAPAIDDAGAPALETGEAAPPEIPATGAREAYTQITGIPPLGAAGGPIQSTSNPITNAFDGDQKTFWTGQKNASSWDLYHGFVTPVSITKLSINYYGSTFVPPGVKIFTSADGTNWTLAAQRTKPGTKPSFTLTGAPVKYLHILLEGNPSSGYAVIREIEWEPTAGHTGSYSPSGFNDDWYFASNAFDNCLKTWWAGKPGAATWTLTHRLTSPRPIGLITAAFYSPSTTPQKTTVLTSSDGITWSTAATFGSGATPTAYIGATAEYLKFVMTGNPSAGYPVVKDIFLNPVPGAASQDSYSTFYTPAKAFDMNPITLWAGIKGLSEWNLYYTLPSPTYIPKIIIHYMDSKHVPVTTLYTSSDGVNWSKSLTFPAGADATIYAAATTKYLKFKMEQPGAPSFSFFPAIKDIDIGINTAPAPILDACGNVIDTINQPENKYQSSGGAPATARLSLLAAGAYHTCAIKSDRSVVCWGANDYYQLGTGNRISKKTPVKVIGVNDAVSIAASDYGTCALLSTGNVKCWGIMNNGNPEEVLGLSNAVNVSVGFSASCAVILDGSVKCWGFNCNSVMGTAIPLKSYTKSAVPIPGITNASTISLGVGHVCVLFKDGRVMCWGNNEFGEAGPSAIGTTITIPQVIPDISNAISVASGHSITCASLSTGSVMCWGYNGVGALGNNSTKSSISPTLVANISSAEYVVLSYMHVCAMRAEGDVRCWGNNFYGSLGNGSNLNSSIPVSIVGLDNVIMTVVGMHHTCAMLADGTLRCWGWNGYGQLGDGTTTTSNVPVKVMNFP